MSDVQPQFPSLHPPQPPQPPQYRGPLLPPPPGSTPPRGSNTLLWIFGLLILGFFGFIALLFIGAIAQVSSAGAGQNFIEEEIQGKGAGRIAVIEVKGVIGDFAGLFGASHMVDKTVKMIRSAAEDKTVKAVVLRVDSPGGGVTASDVIYNEIKKLKEKKPIVVHMGDLCASGGVYISAPANKLVASPTTITGSIGVIISHTDMTKLYEEKLGMKDEPIKSGKHKDILSTGRAMTTEERALIQGLVDEMYDRFLSIVAEGRAGKNGVPAKLEEAKEHIRKVADGRIFSGEMAVKNGLVDRVGYFEDAITEAETLAGIKDATVFRYKQMGGLFASMADGFSQTPKPFSQADLLNAQTPRFEYRFNLPSELPPLLPFLK